ncbi:unnamed protein product, partial [Brassica rapa subsp. narinosa]
MTMREFYAYQLQTRPSEGMTIIKSGRLLHQLNQKKLRAELYTNICDAVNSGDTDAKELGKRIILPSSFTAGPRQHLDVYGGDTANNRPDLECRIFKLKLDEMMSDFKKGVFFPKPAAVVYTVEFQKRGLPHAHILLWFEGFKGEPSAAVIDQYISAELPNKETDREGFELVERHMMHGPCGRDRPKSPCMEKGECTKNYPKSYSDNTRIDKSGFVVYKRRADERSSVLKGDTTIGNQYVVPHNLSLLKKYQAHINIEWCCKTNAIKYLFKYITKGVDRSTVLLKKTREESVEDGEKKKQKIEVDEIEKFQDCRYISACEASWRLFSFHIHHNQPSVMKLA